MEPGNTAAIRSGLIAGLEAAYYSGATAGQMWLHDLSAYVVSLPSDDPRLTQLAALAEARPIDEFLGIEARRVVSSLDPPAWLDDYTAWTAGDRDEPVL